MLHNERVHVRALEIRTAAVTSGLICLQEATTDDSSLTKSLTTRNKIEIAALLSALRNLAGHPAFDIKRMSWTIVSHANDTNTRGLTLPISVTFHVHCVKPKGAPHLYTFQVADLSDSHGI